MIVIGIVLGIVGIGFLCWLLFSLAFYALPFLAAVSAGRWYETMIEHWRGFNLRRSWSSSPAAEPPDNPAAAGHSPRAAGADADHIRALAAAVAGVAQSLRCSPSARSLKSG